MPIEVEAVPIPVSAQCSPARQRVRLPGVNLLSGLIHGQGQRVAIIVDQALHQGRLHNRINGR